MREGEPEWTVRRLSRRKQIHLCLAFYILQLTGWILYVPVTGAPASTLSPMPHQEKWSSVVEKAHSFWCLAVTPTLSCVQERHLDAELPTDATPRCGDQGKRVIPDVEVVHEKVKSVRQVCFLNEHLPFLLVNQYIISQPLLSQPQPASHKHETEVANP